MFKKIADKLYWWREKTNYVNPHLPLGYYDKDLLMQEAMFNLVIDFVSRKEEDALSVISFSEREDVLADIVDILHFYHIRKPNLENRIEKSFNRWRDCCDMLIEENGLIVWKYKTSEAEADALYELYLTLEEALLQETQHMLHKCVDVRLHLWS